MQRVGRARKVLQSEKFYGEQARSAFITRAN